MHLTTLYQNNYDQTLHGIGSLAPNILVGLIIIVGANEMDLHVSHK